MKIKTSELTGAALDWAVASAKGYSKLSLTISGEAGEFKKMHGEGYHNYSTDWSQGGPIIEREKIAIDWDHDCWNASTNNYPAYYSASTPLIAGMRCYAASKLGDEVEIPDELAAA